MVDKICENCVHWERNKFLADDKRFGRCLKIENDVSGEGLLDDDEKVEISDDEVKVSDSEMYNARLETGQNFGCIHFKEE